MELSKSRVVTWQTAFDEGSERIPIQAGATIQIQSLKFRTT